MYPHAYSEPTPPWAFKMLRSAQLFTPAQLTNKDSDLAFIENNPQRTAKTGSSLASDAG
jgi:hypothetical protein